MTVLNKYDWQSKRKRKKNADSQFHNVLRLFDVFSIFPFTTSEAMGDTDN